MKNDIITARDENGKKFIAAVKTLLGIPKKPKTLIIEIDEDGIITYSGTFYAVKDDHETANRE